MNTACSAGSLRTGAGIRWPASKFLNLITKATTVTNLNVHAKLDPNTFATGRKVTKLELKSLNLNVTQDTFHGEWKYSFTFN